MKSVKLFSKLFSSIRFTDVHYQGMKGITSSYWLRGEKENDLILVDPGPQSSVPQLLRFMEKNSISPGDVKKIFITHQHLDHCGCVGYLMKNVFQNEETEVVCHKNIAPHLIDPSRLLHGTKSLYGEEMFSKYIGEVEPVPESCIVCSGNGDSLFNNNKTERNLTIYEAKGHVNNHLVLHDEDENVLYVGDNFGISVKREILPCWPPNEFNPSEARKTLNLFQELSPQAICQAHFGVIEGKEDLENGFQKLFGYLDYFETLMTETQRRIERGMDEKEVCAYLRNELIDQIYRDAIPHDLDNFNIYLNVQGIYFAAQKQFWNQIKSFFSTIYEEGKMEKLKEFIHKDISHVTEGAGDGVEYFGIDSFRSSCQIFQTANLFFTDRKCQVKLKKAEGPTYFFHMKFEGKNKEGKELKLESENEFTFKKGKIIKAKTIVK